MLNCRLLVTPAVCLLLSAIGAIAQDRGTIRGVVTDQGAAAIPGASITVKNVATGLTQHVKTGPDGIYTVLYLPSGEYTVNADKAGFR